MAESHAPTDADGYVAGMYAHGLDTFRQLPFEEAGALADLWIEDWRYPTRGEVMWTVHMLKRAERLGLASSVRDGRLWWSPTEDGIEAAKPEFEGVSQTRTADSDRLIR